jgi:beta-glucosidase
MTDWFARPILCVRDARLQGTGAFGIAVIHRFRNIFPVPLAMVSSWDPDLIADLAHMAAIEARTAGVDWVYSPKVDIARDACWGRCTEGAGKTYLVSAIARAYIRGYQGDSLRIFPSIDGRAHNRNRRT